MKYTPRQMYFWLALVAKRKAAEAATSLSLNRLSAHGAARDVTKQMKELQKQAR